MDCKHSSVHFSAIGSKGEDIVIKPGGYNYPFAFQLPQGLPGSYEDSIGKIRYSITAHVDIPWAFDKTVVFNFTVLSVVDLNAHPQMKVVLHLLYRH